MRDMNGGRRGMEKRSEKGEQQEERETADEVKAKLSAW